MAIQHESLSHDELLTIADLNLAKVLFTMVGESATAREDQTTAVRALVADRARVLVVQATGWGKSAVYWAATAALRSLGEGPTLVVSPLLALMRDQVAAATRAGLSAVTINSTNVDDWDRVMEAVEGGAVDVLLVSPERLANPAFAKRVGPIIEKAGLIVIDEAHCISDWGFDFRPDYQRLSKVLTSAPTTPVLATTATANSRVTADVARQLGAQTLVLRGSLARNSLRLSVVPGLDALERYAWVDAALDTMQGSGIVYVPTVAETERLSEFLVSQGHVVVGYSGKLDTETRERIEDDLRANNLKAVVATSALGMGYDKPDLGFCIHVGSPDSPVAYYQQVGRAGRAIDNAEAVLLPAETDERLWEYFATSTIPDPKNIEKVLAALGTASAPLSVPKITDATGIRRGRLEALLKIMAVDDAVERTTQGWRATGTGYFYDAAKWSAIVAARSYEADLMRSYARGAGCLMEFLQRALDDVDPGPCGTCSVCTGEIPGPGRTVDPAGVEAARIQLRGIDVVIEPRKMWPSGLSSGRRGTIVGADEGRALTFADTPGWNNVASLLSGPDQPLPENIIRGVVSVLTRWKESWGTRPIGVVPMPSRHHSSLVHDLARHVATVGKLPLFDALTIDGPRAPENATSTAQVESLVNALRLRTDVELPYGPILLIDDSYRTGWTMTVAASLLREAGVTRVMPLVVHQLP
jgi:ATP-dependent DNA helicase RecQ